MGNISNGAIDKLYGANLINIDLRSLNSTNIWFVLLLNMTDGDTIFGSGDNDDLGDRKTHVELQSHHDLVCRLLLEKKKKKNIYPITTSNLLSSFPTLPHHALYPLIITNNTILSIYAS